MHDPGLVLVEGKTPGLQPLGQPRLDLLGLLPGVAARREVIGVSDQHRGARHRLAGFGAGGPIPGACGLFQPMECDVEQQRADHPALWSSLLGGGEPVPGFEHARLQPAADHVPAGKRAEHGQKVVMVDPVERRGQVGVEDPQPLGVRDAERAEQGLDRVLTAATRPKPIRARFEPGLPLGLQRVADPCLVAPVHDHRDAEGALFPIGLRDVHPLDRQGCQEPMLRCTRSATPIRRAGVNATSPSTPAVTRPALRCVTWRTLTSVFDQDRSIIFCKDRTCAQSCSCVALKILRRSRRT